MFRIVVPREYSYELEYICFVIFKTFLGLEYEIEYNKKSKFALIYASNGTICMANELFSYESSKWLTEQSLPIFPLEELSAESDGMYLGKENLPVIYGRRCSNGLYVERSGNNLNIGIDIFGSIFFMLTRYEEVVLKDRDGLDRFPVESSLAYKAGFLDRPIVNEYVDLLWQALKVISPGIVRKEYLYKVVPTHDIDKPFGMVYDSPLQLIRHFAGDIIGRHSIRTAIKRAGTVGRMLFSRKGYIEEKLSTYEFIFKQSQLHNLQDMFFFMNSKVSWYDGNYTVDEPEVLALIKRIVSEGHTVGLHPSFVSYNNGTEILDEAAYMNRVFADAGILALNGARQHYLRWKNPDTWQYYEDAGIKVDSTLTFAGCAGFRAGVCYPYPVYNLITRKKLNLVERPLIVMDGSLYEYMRLSHDEALSLVKKLANECRKHGGEFVILWHNTMLDDNKEREFYAGMLNEVCDDVRATID